MSTRIGRRLRGAGPRVLALAATIVVASRLSQAQTHVTSVFTGPYVEINGANEGGSCIPVTPTLRQTNGLSLSANLTCGSAKVVVAMSMVLSPTTITGLPTTATPLKGWAPWPWIRRCK
jgi:hypothetical protein